MCGIVGIIGQKSAAPLLMEALKRLEYRGYDSAGVATLEAGHIERRRAEGKLKNLTTRLEESPLFGRIGIGHTRWATHGAPTEQNAHPHGTDRVAVVHNGIIENFHELKAEFEAKGVKFESATDTEVIVHLVDQSLRIGMSPQEAVTETLNRLEGSFALAILFEGRDDLLIGARRGSPLAIGHGDHEMFIGSDAFALAPFTDQITYLEDGDWVVLTHDGAVIYNAAGEKVERPLTVSAASSLMVDKGNYKHFMEKEIHEQPEVVGHTFAHYLDLSESRASLPADFTVDWKTLDRLTITACGTAFYAGRVAQYWFERLARLPVDIDVASEFRYREVPLSAKGLTLVISQSGETADTLAGSRYAKKEGQRVVAIVNTLASSMVREADFHLPTLAGPEIGVASTKAFTCQLAVLLSLAIAAGRARGVLSAEEETRLVRACASVPNLMSKVLKLGKQVQIIAKNLNGTKDAIFIGRGRLFPIAMEGALKLKEISYIHAEGYAAGELKHGPIALIDKYMPVIAIAPSDRWFEKTLSNIQEIAARDGRLILITDEAGYQKSRDIKGISEVLILPSMPEEVTPLVYALPLQQLAYYSAEYRGKDVDQPRNLAKSVTVE